jgi:hypothetical protein
MKLKLPILLIFLCFNLAAYYAQETIIRKYNRNTDYPKFWIVGVDYADFPFLKENASKIDSLRYGQNILKWIESKPTLLLQIEKFPANFTNISFIDFQKFNSEQRGIFKELSITHEPILIFQKNRIKQFENTQIGIKKTKEENTSQQVYLLNKVELLNWKKRLGI